MNLPQYQSNEIDVLELNLCAEKYGIYYTIHLDENLNPCDINPAVADAYTNTVVQAIQLAHRLQIPILNVHLSSGVYFTLPDKKVFLFEKYKDIYLKKLSAFRDACSVAIGNADIKICIENTNGYSRSNFLLEGLDFLLESPCFALTFDIGHNHTSGKDDESIILARHEKLVHMHIHDAIENRDHLVLGTGDLDIEFYLNLAREQNCRCVLETKTEEALRRSIRYLKEKHLFYG
jgi:sugar phosphate isomerase/epimerase